MEAVEYFLLLDLLFSLVDSLLIFNDLLLLILLADLLSILEILVLLDIPLLLLRQLASLHPIHP